MGYFASTIYSMMRKTLYISLLGILSMLISSCSSSQQSASMRQIEKHAKKNPVGIDGRPVPTSGKAKKATEQQKKQQEAMAKEAEKAYKDGLTRHRSIQTQETRDRMDRNVKESEKKYSNKKAFFVVRWFQPTNDIEKIEKQRAKEVQKRMAASLKKAEKTNKELGIVKVKTGREQKSIKPADPRDMPQGGGGVYKESTAKGVNPTNMSQGGGGSYTEGKSKKKQKNHDSQPGGGGNYQSKKSKKSQTPSDYQQGGGGNMSGKNKKK